MNRKLLVRRNVCRSFSLVPSLSHSGGSKACGLQYDGHVCTRSPFLHYCSICYLLNMLCRGVPSVTSNFVTTWLSPVLFHSFCLVASMLVQCWYNACPMLVQCWYNAGTMLVECWYNAGTMVVQCWYNAVVQCWYNAGTMLVKCGYNVCTMLV
jgi:hypothetical protein